MLPLLLGPHRGCLDSRPGCTQSASCADATVCLTWPFSYIAPYGRQAYNVCCVSMCVCVPQVVAEFADLPHWKELRLDFKSDPSSCSTDGGVTPDSKADWVHEGACTEGKTESAAGDEGQGNEGAWDAEHGSEGEVGGQGSDGEGPETWEGDGGQARQRSQGQGLEQGEGEAGQVGAGEPHRLAKAAKLIPR